MSSQLDQLEQEVLSYLEKENFRLTLSDWIFLTYARLVSGYLKTENMVSPKTLEILRSNISRSAFRKLTCCVEAPLNRPVTVKEIKFVLSHKATLKDLRKRAEIDKAARAKEEKRELLFNNQRGVIMKNDDTALEKDL